MTITAKYASTCPVCQRPITPGQKVEWEKGRKATHSACSESIQTGAGQGDTTGAAPAVPGAGRTITVERVGRRSYLRGDTLPVRSLLRGGGCHWDAEQRAWWIGSHEAALALAEQARGAEAEAAPRKRITHCVGCGGGLDTFQQRRGFRFCSSDCALEQKMGSGWSGYDSHGRWHQGSDD